MWFVNSVRFQYKHHHHVPKRTTKPTYHHYGIVLLFTSAHTLRRKLGSSVSPLVCFCTLTLCLYSKVNKQNECNDLLPTIQDESMTNTFHDQDKISWRSLSMQHHKSNARAFITARNEVGARLCFYTCVRFCSHHSVHAGIPTPGKDPPWQGTPPLQGIPPPLRSACWEIRSTSGPYASYWNVILVFTCSPQSQRGTWGGFKMSSP